jgi:hypothetical protein
MKLVKCAIETGGFLAQGICQIGKQTSLAVSATSCFLKGRELNRLVEVEVTTNGQSASMS